MKTKLLAAVLGFAFMAVAVPARAEVVTMVCNGYTFDVDLARNTLFYAAGANGQATVSIQVTDRFIEWANPWRPDLFRHRIDRSTGFYYERTTDSGWNQLGTCQRAGKPVL